MNKEFLSTYLTCSMVFEEQIYLLVFAGAFIVVFIVGLF